MYRITFPPYSEGEKTTAQTAWRFLWLGFRHRDLDPMSRRMHPLVQLGTDPDRIHAAIELKRLLETSGVERGPDRVLDPKGAEWVMEENVYKLAMEVRDAWTGRFAGLDEGQTILDVRKFLDPSDDGPTRKMTPEEYKASLAKPETE